MRILLVHPGFLGDTVFLGPAVRALKAKHPASTIGLCVSARGAPVAKLLPGCDEVIEYDKRGKDRGVAGFRRTVERLRVFKPDVALVTHYSVRAGALGWLSKAPRRIGYAPIFCNERVRLDRSLS